MIGKILADRYQIIEVRGSGRVLVTEDTHRPGYPLCLVQRLQGAATNPQGFQIAKLILEQRVEAIGRLGKFSQIPAFLTFFESEQGLYLLEEIVMGQSLTQELIPEEPWSEIKTCTLIHEILEILVYVHQYNVILRGLRPNNLIRRQIDGKLVVVNLLLLPPRLRSSQIDHGVNRSMNREGDSEEVSHIYMPPEQIAGNPIFNSNLYSLGMITLQALTGLEPKVLPEIKTHWRDRVVVSPKLGVLLDRMLADDSRDRYRSAKEALKALQQVTTIEKHHDPEATQSLFIPTRPPHPPKYSPSANLKNQASTIAQYDDSYDDFHVDSRIDAYADSYGNSSDSSPRLRAVKISDLSIHSDNPPLIQARSSDISSTQSNDHRSLGNHQADDDLQVQDFNSDYASKTTPTELNPPPIPNNLQETLISSPIEEATKQPFLQLKQPIEQSIEPSLSVSRLQQSKPWWRSKRILGGLSLGLGLVALLAWYFKLPQVVLSSYHLSQGQEKSNRSEFQDAIEQFNESLHWDGQNSDAFFSRGYVFYQIRNFRQSFDDFTQVINLEPNTNLAFSAYFYRGNLRMSLGDLQGAIRDYSQAIENQAIEVDGMTALTFVQPGQAENTVGKSDNAVKSYGQTIRLEPNLAAAYLNRCLKKSNLNNQSGAINDCTEVTGINPNLLRAYQNRALAYQRVGNYKQAIADLNVAINLDSEDATSYYQRGLVWLDLKDKEGAIGDFNRALQFKNDHVFAYYQRGLAQEKNGNVNGAIADFGIAMKLCLEQGMTGCYRDAQYQLKRLGQTNNRQDSPKVAPNNDAIFKERYTSDSRISSP